MLSYIRYLILTVLVIIVTFESQQTLAAPENMVTEVKEGASLISMFVNANTCAQPGQPCKERCNCCQDGIDSYDCKGDGANKVCTSTQPKPLECPNQPKDCKAYDKDCKEDCDCCQYDPERKASRKCTCERDWSAYVYRKKCVPAPFVYVDCFAPTTAAPPTKP